MVRVLLLLSAFCCILGTVTIASAEHCAGADEVVALEPADPQIWVLGDVREISWLVGASCGLMTYRVEISRNGGDYQELLTTEPLFFDGRYAVPWDVFGAPGEQLRFRVHRVVDGRLTPRAVTATVTLSFGVATEASTWGVLKARFGDASSSGSSD